MVFASIITTALSIVALAVVTVFSRTPLKDAEDAATKKEYYKKFPEAVVSKYDIKTRGARGKAQRAKDDVLEASKGVIREKLASVSAMEQQKLAITASNRAEEQSYFDKVCLADNVREDKNRAAMNLRNKAIEATKNEYQRAIRANDDDCQEKKFELLQSKEKTLNFNNSQFLIAQESIELTSSTLALSHELLDDQQREQDAITNLNMKTEPLFQDMSYAGVLRHLNIESPSAIDDLGSGEEPLMVLRQLNAHFILANNEFQQMHGGTAANKAITSFPLSHDSNAAYKQCLKNLLFPTEAYDAHVRQLGEEAAASAPTVTISDTAILRALASPEGKAFLDTANGRELARQIASVASTHDNQDSPAKTNKRVLFPTDTDGDDGETPANKRSRVE